MNRIELLAKKFEDHISLPWQPHLSSEERTIFIVYPKDDELRLRAKKDLFQQAAQKSGHSWHELSLDSIFPQWMSSQEYAEDYFEFPEDIGPKLESDFSDHVAEKISEALDKAGPKRVLGINGVGCLFGLTHFAPILRKLSSAVQGRLVVFFPGSHEKNTYRLLDARDGWGYLAYPITLTEVSYT